MVAILVDGLETFAKVGCVRWGLRVVHVVESHRLVSFELVDVYTSSICTPLALLEWAVEPDDGIEARSDHHLGRHLLGSRLHEKEGILHLSVSLNWIQLLSGLVAAHCLLKELRLRIAAGEVD